MQELSIRVYYEDTDLGGIVYYANYLKFIERGRTEAIRSIGVDQLALKRDLGLVFVVRRIEADYLRPAVFDDILSVTTRVTAMGAARIGMEQKVLRGDETLFDAQVTLALLDGRGRPARIPAEIRDRIAHDLV